ncbi:MAG: tetratricopeptide repeat protein [Myxococcales bacterium]|nr:tetratricopeptide repeat protein [Myxococcales bacterium]
MKALWPAAGFAVILAGAVASYSPALEGEFNFDDETSITEVPAVKDLGRFLTTGFVPGFPGGARPVVDLSYAIDYRRAGLNAPAFHRTNLLIHLAMAVLVFFFTRAVAARAVAARAGAGGNGLAVAVTAMFALHPLQTQAVSYICQRAETLASLFYLAMLLLLLAFERLGARRGALLYLGAVLSLVLALGSKAHAATAPLAFLLLALALRGTQPSLSPRARLAGSIPLLLTALAHATRVAVGLKSGSTDAGLKIEGLDPWRYLLTQGPVVLRYLRLLVWPTGQNLDYDFPISKGLLDPATALPGALVLAVLALGGYFLIRRRESPRQRLAGFGLVWFFLVLAPTSTVMPLADVIEEHRVYLASWGIFFAVALAGKAALERLAPTRARALGAAAVALGCIAMGSLTFARNQVWRTSEALWSDVIAKSPRKPRGYMNLGYALSRRKAWPEAIDLYGEALRRMPDRSVRFADLMRNRGAALLALGRHAEAVADFRAGLRESPNDADLLNNLAIALYDEGKLVEASMTARQALEAKPDHGGALNTLGEALLAQGELEVALGAFRRSVELGPDVPSRTFNLALVLDRLGRTGEACAKWRRYLVIESDPPARAEVEAHLRSGVCDGE